MGENDPGHEVASRFRNSKVTWPAGAAPAFVPAVDRNEIAPFEGIAVFFRDGRRPRPPQPFQPGPQQPLQALQGMGTDGAAACGAGVRLRFLRPGILLLPGDTWS